MITFISLFKSERPSKGVAGNDVKNEDRALEPGEKPGRKMNEGSGTTQPGKAARIEGHGGDFSRPNSLLRRQMESRSGLVLLQEL